MNDGKAGCVCRRKDQFKLPKIKKKKSKTGVRFKYYNGAHKEYYRIKYSLNPSCQLPEEWKKCLRTFLDAVGARPSHEHFLCRKDLRRPMGPKNFKWDHRDFAEFSSNLLIHYTQNRQYFTPMMFAKRFGFPREVVTHAMQSVREMRKRKHGSHLFRGRNTVEAHHVFPRCHAKLISLAKRKHRHSQELAQGLSDVLSRG